MSTAVATPRIGGSLTALLALVASLVVASGVAYFALEGRSTQRPAGANRVPQIRSTESPSTLKAPWAVMKPDSTTSRTRCASSRKTLPAMRVLLIRRTRVSHDFWRTPQRF